MREFLFPVRVYYEDTDAGGVVYHARYLNFFERARTECLRALGLGQRRLREQLGVVFAVRRAEVDYRRPARLDDALLVSSRIPRLRPASVDFDQTLVAEDDRSVLATARLRIACLEAATLRPIAIPPPISRVLFDVC